MNVLKNTTALALVMCQQYVREDGTAVDATCGNGHDSLWLCERFRKVWAFDIQEEAIRATEKLLQEAGCSNVEMVQDSHEHMEKYVEGPVQVILFNLGYLPGGDKRVTTEGGSTLRALDGALRLLAVDGLLCVTLYQGHEEGFLERKAVLDWAAGLDKGIYHCVRTDMVNQPNRPPEVVWITKKK